MGHYPAGASPYGGLDMSGQVWEWVNDWYDFSYYSSAPASNPSGPITGTDKVLRGGDWYHLAENVRVAAHGTSAPTSQYDNFGFRCAATP